jgi:predicted nucleotidyltransferase
MISLLQTNLDKLAKLCRDYGVARLEVFGSAANESFDPARSDVDFLVEFRPEVDLGPWLARYFDLRDRLSTLLGRNVDLVMMSALRNPYFIREVNRTRELLYAA